MCLLIAGFTNGQYFLNTVWSRIKTQDPIGDSQVFAKPDDFKVIEAFRCIFIQIGLLYNFFGFNYFINIYLFGF